jgi:hypothetical protein
MIGFFLDATEQSINSDRVHTACAYRKDNTVGSPSCCAVGYLIPDNLWEEEFNFLWMEELENYIRDSDFIEFLARYNNELAEFQSLHDLPESWDKFGYKDLKPVLSYASTIMSVPLTEEETQTYTQMLTDVRAKRESTNAV